SCAKGEARHRRDQHGAIVHAGKCHGSPSGAANLARPRTEIASDLVERQMRKACRARSFQPPPSFTQTCITPIFGELAFPPASTSAAKTWRAMALLATTATLGLLSVIDLKIVFLSAMAATNSALVSTLPLEWA